MFQISPLAVDPAKSRGRVHKKSRGAGGKINPEDEAENRSAFQLDRDRVLHSRAWRRMRGKTQVFVAGYGDHYRDRMTHSLEVAQISRDLARALQLNEDLAEVIALAHDLGHSPFGHGGEHALHECLSKDGLHFEHNEQSLRVVTEIEQIYPGHRGLNLSYEVLDGLRKHETSWDHPILNTSPDAEVVRPSLEAQVVNLGDEIAYQNHDVDDGLRSGLISEEDLAELELWKMAVALTESEYGKIEDERVRRSRTISKMMSLMIEDVLLETRKNLAEKEIKTLEDVYAYEQPLVGFSPEFLKHNEALKNFLLNRMYFHPKVVSITQRGQQVVKDLYGALRKTMEPAEVRDYLAGMTDHFAQLEWEKHFGSVA
jgi:dGTPase